MSPGKFNATPSPPGGGFSLPVLDLSPFMGPGFGETDRIEAARALDDACRCLAE